jgi:hypothetical protein
VLWSIAGAIAMEFIGCASTLSCACNLFVVNMFYLHSHWFVGVWSSQRYSPGQCIPFSAKSLIKPPIALACTPCSFGSQCDASRCDHDKGMHCLQQSHTPVSSNFAHSLSQASQKLCSSFQLVMCAAQQMFHVFVRSLQPTCCRMVSQDTGHIYVPAQKKIIILIQLLRCSWKLAWLPRKCGRV